MTRKRPATPAPASRSRSAEGRQRAPGRPPANRRGADGDVRERLLDAAIACYVRGGIAATSLREIAREAQVTPALLNYYFGGKDELRDLARLRLAALLLDEKAFDQALKQLEGSVSPSFELRFIELKGDILSAQDKKSEAAGAYQSALGKLKDSVKTVGSESASPGWQGQSSVIYQQLLQQKLDALGGEQ